MQQSGHRTKLLSVTLLTALATAPQAFATEMSHGKMAATIRSANHPCAHVISLESAGENAWNVKCNSGKFDVKRDDDGKFSVTRTE
jgi:hypothetical protein